MLKNLKGAVSNIFGLDRTKMPDGSVQINKKPWTGKLKTKVEDGQVEPVSVPLAIAEGVAGAALLVGGIITGKKVYDNHQESKRIAEATDITPSDEG